MRLTLFGVSLLSLALPFTAWAEPHARPNAHRHRDVANRARGDMNVYKREYDNVRCTFYAVGLGACGVTNVPSDFIVALSQINFGSGYPGPYCFQGITISYGGKTAQATIMDECEACPDWGLDFSEGLFDYFADESVGVIYATWWFNSDGPASSSSTPTSTYVAPPPSSTYTPPTSTWSSTSSTWSSSSSSSSQSSSTSSSASSSATTSTSSGSTSWSSSASSTGTSTSSSSAPTASPTGNLESFSQAVLGMGDVIVGAGAA